MNELDFKEIGFLIGCCKTIQLITNVTDEQKEMAKNIESKLLDISINKLKDLAK